MEALTWSVTQAEREFYGEHLVLLEGAISEFLSCMDMIRRYRVSLGKDDPVASVQARIKGADSMRQKLKRQGLPVTVDSALHKVWDAAGVRLICPFVSEIYTTASLIRGHSRHSGFAGERLCPVPQAKRLPQLSYGCLSAASVFGEAAAARLAGASDSHHCHGLLGQH